VWYADEGEVELEHNGWFRLGRPYRAKEYGQHLRFDDTCIPFGKAVFFMVTGVADGKESSLGTNTAGAERPNSNPCP